MLLTALAGWGFLAQPAGAAAAAPRMTLSLSSATIVADGKSTATATATVTKANGTAALLDNVVFSSNAGQLVGPTTNNHDGTYTATITATTTARKATITATDTSRPLSATKPLSAQATLTQMPGPAAHIALQLSPHSILANGDSKSTATASVTDAFGNPVPGQTIAFSSSDAGIHFTAVADSGDGTYTATLTSSMTPGHATITATEPVTKVSGQATLILATVASVASLSVAPSASVTNQVVTLIAIVTAPGSGSVPSGTITFENNGAPIPACINQPVLVRVAQQLGQSACQVTFKASTSPQQLSAVFTSNSANIADSSTTAAVTVGRGNTSTSLDVSNPTVDTGATATFTARVLSSNLGPVDPSGSVEFIDAGQQIAACARQPLTVGPASSTATCSVRYARAGTHSITAVYSGDANFKASSSAAQPVSVHALPPQVLGTIKATMQWTFLSTLTYTKIRLLVVHQAPIGATITATCRGRGCPYAKRVNNVRRTTACKPTPARRCPTARTGIVNLQPGFQNRSLRVAGQVIVRITRPGWIGKYYLFTIRAGRAPSVRIDCLAPGGSRPGLGC